MRRLGPPMVVVTAVTLLGFGTHAALDWHHHGSADAGFFHLHAHAGAHHHDPVGIHDHAEAHDHDHVVHNDEHGHHHYPDLHHDHHHPQPVHPEPGSPAPNSPSDRQDDTYTIAFGAAPAPAAVSVEAPNANQEGRLNPRFPVRIAHEHANQPWIPRGPPA